MLQKKKKKKQKFIRVTVYKGVDMSCMEMTGQGLGMVLTVVAEGPWNPNHSFKGSWLTGPAERKRTISLGFWNENDLGFLFPLGVSFCNLSKSILSAWGGTEVWRKEENIGYLTSKGKKHFIDLSRASWSGLPLLSSGIFDQESHRNQKRTGDPRPQS